MPMSNMHKKLAHHPHSFAAVAHGVNWSIYWTVLLSTPSIEPNEAAEPRGALLSRTGSSLWTRVQPWGMRPSGSVKHLGQSCWPWLLGSTVPSSSIAQGLSPNATSHVFPWSLFTCLSPLLAPWWLGFKKVFILAPCTARDPQYAFSKDLTY